MGYPLEESDFAERVRWELDRARQKHGAQHSLHEGYAVLLEEVEEFWEEMRKQKPDRLKLAVELIQIGAMAQRCAEDCGLPVAEYVPENRRQPTK